MTLYRIHLPSSLSEDQSVSAWPSSYIFVQILPRPLSVVSGIISQGSYEKCLSLALSCCLEKAVQIEDLLF